MREHVEPAKPEDIEGAPRRRVDFAVISEPFNEYELDDGHVIRIKHVMMEVQRIEGKFNPDGTPMYSLDLQSNYRVLKKS